MTRRLEITLSEDQWSKLEEARGFEPRASFVKRHLAGELEKALGGVGPAGSGTPVSVPERGSTPRPSAPSRASAGYELPKIAPRKPR